MRLEVVDLVRLRNRLGARAGPTLDPPARAGAKARGADDRQRVLDEDQQGVLAARACLKRVLDRLVENLFEPQVRRKILKPTLDALHRHTSFVPLMEGLQTLWG